MVDHALEAYYNSRPQMKILLSGLLLLATSSLGTGALVAYGFTGVIGEIVTNENDILGSLDPGDVISGSFSYDPLAPDGGTDSDRTLTFSIGSRHISIASTLNFVRTRNDVSVSGLGIVDRFSIAFD